MATLATFDDIDDYRFTHMGVPSSTKNHRCSTGHIVGGDYYGVFTPPVSNDLILVNLLTGDTIKTIEPTSVGIRKYVWRGNKLFMTGYTIVGEATASRLDVYDFDDDTWENLILEDAGGTGGGEVIGLGTGNTIIVALHVLVVGDDKYKIYSVDATTEVATLIGTYDCRHDDNVPLTIVGTSDTIYFYELDAVSAYHFCSIPLIGGVKTDISSTSNRSAVGPLGLHYRTDYGGTNRTYFMNADESKTWSYPTTLFNYVVLLTFEEPYYIYAVDSKYAETHGFYRLDADETMHEIMEEAMPGGDLDYWPAYQAYNGFAQHPQDQGTRDFYNSISVFSDRVMIWRIPTGDIT